MRSRFTAFTLHEFQYLIDTHHPSKRQTTDLLELQSGSDKTTWFKLTIHRIKLGLANNDKGLVEFSAFFNENGQFFELRETSSFIKEAAQWLYLEGNSHIEHINLKIKRNEPCWCCSGKKFKHCHARIEINAIQA
ncbi:MAG: zinc-binding protein [Cycloclasticus sp. symbiont of Bathymodiolus heckerae]|nr:MAG: zinc-binding protein [Cycloclasticus sp. symbiont of Bathymodiolus heckerae]